MKKIILLLMSVITLNSFSQKQDKSVGFEEPQGWSKLVQLKNNNTFFVEFTKKEGINVMLFDATRKKIASDKLTLTMIDDKLGYYIISGIYEIAGDVAIFYQKAEDRTPVLIRILIDGKTGKLKSEEKIAELNKITTGDAYAAAFGDVDMPDLKIVKDPESDYYALIRYNTFAPETKDRIEVFHYSPQHKVINKANYTAPDNKYKFTKYLSAYVHKDDYVVIGTYAFNTKKSGGEEARFYVSQLAKGKTSFVQKELAYSEFYKGARGHFIYNNIKGTINMVLITDVEIKGDSRKYDIVFQSINPTTLQLEKPYKIDYTKANDIYKNKLNRKDDFFGMIQGTFIDKNGNLIVLSQNTTIKYGNGSGIVGTFLGDFALITISPEGKVINTAVIPANVYVSGKHKEFNCNDIRTGYRPADSWDDPGLASEQYFAIDVITTDNSNYIFFNNTQENMELPESEEPKLVKAISITTAVKYTYSNNTIKKEYIFGTPKDKKDNDFCNFSSSDYNASTKSYATLVTDPKTKKSSIVWLKLD
jgi:hypothetical protein